MVDSSSWKQMKQVAFESFKSDNRLDERELEQIVEIGCQDGNFDEDEKAVLINIITNLTRADLNSDMWKKVAELITKFELEHDLDATIEALNEEES